MRRIRLNQIKKNEPTTFEFTKSDVTTGVELDGATLTVLDKDGNTIDSWTSVKNQPHVIKRLVVGETYILREEFAPYGYLKATDVEFTDVYSHIIDDDRRKNAELFEEAFYEKKDLDPSMHAHAAGKTVELPTDVDAELLAKVLSNPEMAALLSTLAKSLEKK